MNTTADNHTIAAKITSLTLKTVPDAPFTSVEVKIPKGPYSILTSNVPAKDEFNLCSQTLSAPTEVVGQNGAVYKHTTKIQITGCTKPKKKTKAKKASKAGRASTLENGSHS